MGEGAHTEIQLLYCPNFKETNSLAQLLLLLTPSELCDLNGAGDSLLRAVIREQMELMKLQSVPCHSSTDSS